MQCIVHVYMYILNLVSNLFEAAGTEFFFCRKKGEKRQEFLRFFDIFFFFKKTKKTKIDFLLTDAECSDRLLSRPTKSIRIPEVRVAVRLVTAGTIGTSTCTCTGTFDFLLTDAECSDRLLSRPTKSRSGYRTGSCKTRHYYRYVYMYRYEYIQICHTTSVAVLLLVILFESSTLQKVLIVYIYLKVKGVDLPVHGRYSYMYMYRYRYFLKVDLHVHLYQQYYIHTKFSIEPLRSRGHARSFFKTKNKKGGKRYDFF